MSDPGRGAAIFGCAGPGLGRDEAAFFREADPFGFILFARNVQAPDQIRRLTADLRACVGREALITIDQEGGRVQRLRAPHWREWQPPLDAAVAAGPAAPRAMALRATLIAQELKALGIDSTCAPVADLASPRTHPFLRNRCYGESAPRVAEIARAVADATLAAGVVPVVKHMPGHGRSEHDTHHDLPRITASAATLHASDFAPFRALNDLPMAMTAHIVFTAIDPENPATRSPAMIRLIRAEIGFQGLLLTDDLNMQALSGTLAARTTAALQAGCDIALHCSGVLAEMAEVAGAAGEMSATSRARAEAALACRKPAPALDLRALAAEYAALTGWPAP